MDAERDFSDRNILRISQYSLHVNIHASLQTRTDNCHRYESIGQRPITILSGTTDLQVSD